MKSEETSESPVPDGGNTSRVSPVRLFGAFSANVATGTLIVRGKTENKEFLFQLGQLVGAASSPIGIPSDRDRGRKNAASVEQTLSYVHDVAAWPHADYIFVPGEVHSTGHAPKPYELLAAAVDGLHGGIYPALLEQTRLPNERPRVFEQSNFFSFAQGEPKLARILSAFDGSQSIAEVAPGFNPAEFWTVLYILRELGCLSFDVLKQRTQKVRSDSERHYEMAKEHMAHRRFVEAEAALLLAVELSPNREDYQCRLAWSRVLQAPNDMPTVQTNLPLLAKAVSAAPSNPDFQFFYAMALYLLGRTAEAMDSVERALAFDPGHPEARVLYQRLAKN